MSLAACAAVPVRDVMKPILMGPCCAHTNPGLRTMTRTSTMTSRTGILFVRMSLLPPRGGRGSCLLFLDDSGGDLARPPAHEGAPVGHEAGDHELAGAPGPGPAGLGGTGVRRAPGGGGGPPGTPPAPPGRARGGWRRPAPRVVP